MITFAIFFVFLLILTSLGLGGYLLWAMQQKLETMAQKIVDLTSKVKAGEEVIAENFETVEKNIAKLDHEIKEVTIRYDAKTKEAIKAARRLRRDGLSQ